MSSTFGRLYISPILPTFLTRYPQVRLSVHLSDHVVDVISAGFDLALRIGALNDSRLVARKLTTNQRVLCASPEYLRLHGTPRSPAELASHECLLLVGAAGRQDVWRLRDADKHEHVVRVSGRFESTIGELLRDAALMHMGIALHSVWHVSDDLRAGRLVVVLPDYSIDDTGIYAVMPQRRLVPLRVRAFIDFLAEHLGDAPPWAPVPLGPAAKKRVPRT
jgi:DNA-binding transcriptional LysR family regulator